MTAASELVAALREVGQTLACCESLTAGLAAATIAEVPGASAVLRGGLITYATDLKHTLAGVDAAVLAEHGPVAAATAAQMASGARQVCGADWGLALTGVAGPDPQDGHPVGEVFLGIVGPGGFSRELRVHPAGLTHFALTPREKHPVRVLNGDRAAIRTRSVEFALREILLNVLEQNAGKGR
ncbi:CinA family protein [Corynebacterium sp. A21]|uniref:CinA family protein n=1 Tax=Corynebacterium sp. A21 TaxID=3457318 RepID=UPI003FD4C458